MVGVLRVWGSAPAWVQGLRVLFTALVIQCTTAVSLWAWFIGKEPLGESPPVADDLLAEFWWREMQLQSALSASLELLKLHKHTLPSPNPPITHHPPPTRLRTSLPQPVSGAAAPNMTRRFFIVFSADRSQCPLPPGTSILPNLILPPDNSIWGAPGKYGYQTLCRRLKWLHWHNTPGFDPRKILMLFINSNAPSPPPTRPKTDSVPVGPAHTYTHAFHHPNPLTPLLQTDTTSCRWLWLIPSLRMAEAGLVVMAPICLLYVPSPWKLHWAGVIWPRISQEQLAFQRTELIWVEKCWLSKMGAARRRLARILARRLFPMRDSLLAATCSRWLFHVLTARVRYLPNNTRHGHKGSSPVVSGQGRCLRVGKYREKRY